MRTAAIVFAIALSRPVHFQHQEIEPPNGYLNPREL